MKIGIVRYGAGNVESVANALRRLGVDPFLADEPGDLENANKIIFPGVGEASSAMRYLRDTGLDEAVRSFKRPVLGICLGMQLLCARSDEGDTECLGVLPYTSHRITSQDVKVPHTGWNNVDRFDSTLFEGVGSGERFYFVHSYAVERCADTIAECDHGGRFSAAIAKDNFYGVQFHPEKSGGAGARVLRNFLVL